MAKAKVEWIKLSTDMFNNPKIKYIRTLPEGNNMLLIWVMLLTKAGICNEHGYIMLTQNVPYTTQMLSNELGFDESIIRLAIGTFERLQMVSLVEDTVCIVGWEDHQNVDGLEKIKEQTRKRVQKHRDKQKQLPYNATVTESNVTNNATSNTAITHGNAIDKELDKEKEYKYIEQMDLLWSLYPNKKGKDKALKKIPKLIEKYGYEQLKKCVERFAAEKQGKDKQFIAYGSTFFTSGYVDYLDENYLEQQENVSKIQRLDPITGEVLA